MKIMHYIGLDIHKKTISFCVKLAGNHNQATLAVARKLVAWLLAVDRRTTGFIRKEATTPQAA